MKKDVLQYHDDTNLSVKRKLNKEVLEISSTGYGLEPALETTEEHTSKATNHTNSSCGGL